MKKLIWLLVLVGLVGGGFYLFKNKASDESMQEEMMEVENGTSMMEDESMEKDSMEMESDSMESDSMQEDSMMEDDSMMMDDSTVTFDVEGGSFYFEPNVIEVNKGDTVTINLTNAGGFHDWVIDEFDVRTEVIETGETDSVTFVADQAGEFEFYCSVGTHREQGMTGTLIVK